MVGFLVRGWFYRMFKGLTAGTRRFGQVLLPVVLILAIISHPILIPFAIGAIVIWRKVRARRWFRKTRQASRV